jgi:hypothetical protein
MINAAEEGTPNKGADDTKRPKSQSSGESNRITRQPMQNRSKTVDSLRTDWSNIEIPDEKVYPTLETVPKYRYSARWECCLLTAPRGSHRRPGDPGPVARLDLPR